jgi:hypothetical protein
VEGVTYNPQISVYGFMRMTLTWMGSGIINAQLIASAMPAVSYQVCVCV